MRSPGLRRVLQRAEALAGKLTHKLESTCKVPTLTAREKSPSDQGYTETLPALFKSHRDMHKWMIVSRNKVNRNTFSITSRNSL